MSPRAGAGRRWRNAVVGAALIGLLAAGGLTAASGLSRSYPPDFPDPAIVFTGGRYWAYATGTAGNQLQVMSSADLRSWSQPYDPLLKLPLWATAGQTWHPSVLTVNGLFVMFYSVRDTALRRQCISEALATVATGPFVDSSLEPLICQPEQGGSIDPAPFVDFSTGRTYLVWKSDDDAIGRPSRLWAQQLTFDGRSLVGPRAQLLVQHAAWQSPTIEGPAMTRVGRTYYLFYGANAWWTDTSGIGYATCASPLGPCTDQSAAGPWLQSFLAMRGPQGPSIFTGPDGVTELAFAAWTGSPGYANRSSRSLWISRLVFRGGIPSLG